MPPAPAGLRPVSASAWFLWLAGLVAAVPTGIAVLFAANNSHHNQEEYAAMIKADLVKWAQVVKAAGIKAE